MKVREVLLANNDRLPTFGDYDHERVAPAPGMKRMRVETWEFIESDQDRWGWVERDATFGDLLDLLKTLRKGGVDICDDGN